MEKKKEKVAGRSEKSLAEQLKEMAALDIRDVDRETLVDIEDVKIDVSLPKEERIREYIRQIGNPYCYLCHGVIVKVSFSGNRSLEDCLMDCVSMQS